MNHRDSLRVPREFDPAWLLVPALLLVLFLGLFLLAGVLEPLPAASAPGGVDAGVAAASAAGA